MARNLFAYSWFVYPFNVAAQLQAFASAELALKTKAAATKQTSAGGIKRPRRREKREGFGYLLRIAIDQRWISDSGFTHLESWRLRGMNRVLGSEPEVSEVKSYSQILVEILPVLRNDLAHGSTTLHYRGAEYLGICAELINQLFDPPQQEAPTEAGKEL